jgi:hypothetical protein
MKHARPGPKGRTVPLVLTLILVLASVLTIPVALPAQTPATQDPSPLPPQQSQPLYQASTQAARIVDIGMEAAKQYMRLAYTENITEQMVIDEIVAVILENGGDPFVSAFWTGETDDTEDAGLIVVSGPDSSIPHGNYDDDEWKQIMPGEVVVIDIGVRYQGRCSDETRTFFMGEPTQEQRDIYQIVLEAHDLAAAHIDQLVPVRELDKIARDHITAKGYGDQFLHSLGHGVGYYVHEPPLITQSFPAGEQLLRLWDVITIEPGIYIQDPEMLDGQIFGVRIEDDYGVLLSGPEQLTHFSTDIEEMVITPLDGQGNANGDDESSSFLKSESAPVILVPALALLAVAAVVVLKKKNEGEEN